MITADCLSLGPRHHEDEFDAINIPQGLTDDQQKQLSEANITRAEVFQACGIARQRREVEVVLLAILTASLAVGWHPRRTASFWWDADDAQPRTPASPTADLPPDGSIGNAG